MPAHFMNLLKEHRNAIVRAVCAVAVVLAIGIGFGFISGLANPLVARAVVGTGTGCCGGGFTGWGWDWPTVTTHLDGGGGGGGCFGDCGGGTDPNPYCTLTANPTSVQSGGAVTLSWTSLYASSATIDNGVGTISPVSAGSTVVHPTQTTTYTMTTSGTWGGVTCQVTVVVPPPTNGCIQVLKETYDTDGNILTPVAQFTFKLDNATTSLNDANGNAIFNNVPAGTHTVTEIVPPTWTQLSVTPANGTVIVTPGPVCAAVVFKNKQVITPPPPTCTLDIDKEMITIGDDYAESATITWTATNAAQVSTDNDDFEITSLTGGTDSVSPDETTTYAITVTGTNGQTVTCSKELKVKRTPPPPKGCIQIKKETYNTASQPITPVAQFTFKLDGNAATTQNDANGNAVFNNVSVGVHTITEIVPATWTQLSVTPVNGVVTVSAGPTCSAVVFKNKQVINTPPPITVQATKIVCDSETDLPNRSGGAHITATTATDFLATHPHCHLAPNWVFEWANESVGNPGDNIGAGGSGWNVFAPTNGNGTTTIAIPTASITGGKIWVREQMNNDYIPFTGVLGGNVSPELYCSTDVLNYDNYDFIDNPTGGQTYYCVAWNVHKDIPHDSPTCTLTSNPNSLTAPGNSTLTWTTTNATSFTINQGVGSVTPVAGGNVGVNATTTTTYIGTASGPGGVVNCPTTVTITPPGPACTLTINKASINTGDSVIVSWTSSNVTEGFINNNVGSTTPVAAGSSVEIFPPSDTTFTGNFTGPYGNVTCTVGVTVHTPGCQGNCGGGGYNPPNVVLYKKPGDSGLVASVFLSQIPYTGFEAGPALTVLFWLAIGLLSAMIAFFALGRRGISIFSNRLAAYVGVPTADEMRNAMGANRVPQYQEYEPVAVHAEPEMPIVASVIAPARPVVSAPVYAAPQSDGETGIPSITDVIESRAHAAGVLMSPESVKLASELSTDRTEALKIFGAVLNDAVKTIPREDGWIMLTSDKLEELASKATVARVVTENVPAFAPQVAVPATPAVSEVRTYSYGERADEASAVAFVTAIVSGNRDAAFGIIRSLEHAAVSPATLMTSTATVLDRLYRVRQGGKNGIDQELVAAATNVNDETLHTLVEVFTHALDIVYTNPFTGVKLALAQAFEVVG